VTTHRHRAGKYRRSGSPEYRSWQSAIYKCTNARSSAWPWYGGRGVAIAPSWRRSFETFLRDVGRKPRGTRLERYSKAWHFAPGNCGWVPRPRGRKRRSRR
jgi:hypothetical protein